jgi:hypothetical protein
MKENKHLAAIYSGEVTRGNVIGIRKALNAGARLEQGLDIGRTSPQVPYEVLASIVTALRQHEPKVIGELHESGLKVLRNPRYRKRLEEVADIVADIRFFRLVRFDVIGHHSLGCVPVFRAWSPRGSFLFRNIPWQSNGNGPEVLEVYRGLIQTA